jgi:peptidoglycan L-alanyl-D-glutamate endopeptidase CwlK
MSSRSLDHLHPEIYPLAVALVSSAPSALGLELLVTDIFRSREEQAALYRIGRNGLGEKIGRVVTNAPPGSSAHEVMRKVAIGPDGPEEIPPLWVHDAASTFWIPAALAFDVAFDFELGKGQRISWAGPWDELGELAESLGLEWGGRWATFRDRPHFQFPGWKEIARSGGWAV